MFLSAYLVLAAAQFPVDARAGENKLTQFAIKAQPGASTFEWSDPEETVRGTLTRPVIEGEPMWVSVSVEPVQGAPYDGPVTLALRPLEGGTEASHTVARAENERVWRAQFTPSTAAPHRLEVSWRSTHHKVIRGVFEVSAPGLPSWVRWVVAGITLAGAIAVGLFITFKSGNEATS